MKAWIWLAAGFWTAAAISAHAADLVVVDSRGINLRPGAVIDSEQALTLGDGQRVTLVASNGGTLKLQGPFEGRPELGSGKERSDVVAALKQLIVLKEARLDQVGVIRASLRGAEPPEPWVLNVSQSGSLCLRKDEQPVFWRPSTEDSALSISPSDRSWSAKAEWPANSNRLVIPTLVPLRDRGVYVIQIGDRKSAITINILPPTLTNDDMRLAWMLEKGCQAQASALARSLR